MPLRSLSFTNSLDKAKHDDLVKLVKRMLKLQEAYVEAEAQLLDERFELKADIDRLDRQIDHIVYDLYGLTPEEIAIVEKHGS